MTTGAIVQRLMGEATPTGLSASVDNASTAPSAGMWKLSDASAGTSSGETAITVAHPDASGHDVPWFGELCLFDKVIVTPRQLNAGFVLSDVVSTVEVWNTFRISKLLSSITDIGDTGVTYSGPTVPRIFPQGAASNWTVTIGQIGGPYANAVITWNVAGVTGADVTTTGTRLVPFTISPDWGAGVVETYSYLTEVLSSRDETEQRILLRSVPDRSLKFTPFAESPRESGLLQNLIFGWQHRVFGLPWWPDAAQLQSAISSGASVIPIDTVNREFIAGGIVLLWSDPFTWEAATILSVTTSQLTLTSTLTNSWAAYSTIVLPVKMARLPLNTELNFPGHDITIFEVNFSVEPTT